MDLNVHAFRLVQQATSETSVTTSKQAASRKGGLAGGRARAIAMSSEQRREIAKKASNSRWAKKTKPGITN
jgi:hypothetical protein